MYYRGDPFNLSDMLEDTDDFHYRIFQKMFLANAQSNRSKIFSKLHIKPAWAGPNQHKRVQGKFIVLLANKDRQVYLTNSSISSQTMINKGYIEVSDFEKDFNYYSYLVYPNFKRNGASNAYLPRYLNDLRNMAIGDFKNILNYSDYQAWNKSMQHDWSYLDRSLPKSA